MYQEVFLVISSVPMKRRKEMEKKIFEKVDGLVGKVTKGGPGFITKLFKIWFGIVVVILGIILIANHPWLMVVGGVGIFLWYKSRKEKYTASENENQENN